MSKEMMIGLFVIVGILTLQIAHAEVFTGQLDALYNLGDNLNTNITLFSSATKTSFLSINIVCDSGKVELYKSPVSVKEGEQKKTPFSTHLDSSILGNVTGMCSLQVDYGNERGESGTFEITNALTTALKTDKTVYLPGEHVKISGTGTRKNGSPVKGFVDVSITGLPASISSLITKGTFNLTFIVPEQTPSRNHIIQARVYERDDSGLLMNEGTSQGVIKVAQVAKTIDVALNSPTLQPGKDLIYLVILTDQANENVRDDVSIILTSSQGKIFDKRLVKSGETQTFALANNATPGLWKIEAKAGTLKGERAWTVEEVANASFSLENSTLTIVNTGNIPFKKSVEVSLNGINEIKDVDLALGEKKSYKLLAPDGTYSITVSDGTQEKELGSSFLTGKSIDIKDLNSFTQGASGSIIFYIIIILALGLVVIGAYRIALKRKYTGKMPLIASRWNEPHLKPVTQQSQSVPFPTRSSTTFTPTKRSIGYAATTGEKKECAVIALTVHNLHELIEDNQASALLERIASHATSTKASVREDRNTHLMIFSPIKTKNENPSLLAVKVGKEIEQWLKEYNQKHALKIQFGIGIHLGEMIVESMQGASAFHAVGNTVIAAKRAAERSSQQVLLTSPVHRKVSGVVKTQQIPAESLWTVTNIVEREDYSDFIDKFMSRQNK